MLKKRYLWADTIRFVAIFLIISLHATPKLNSNSVFSGINNFFNLLTQIGVPLFIILSGSLLLNKKENYLIFFKKRLVKVVIPWIIWTTIWLIWQSSQDKIFTSFSSFLNFIHLAIYTRFWFIPLIISLYFLTPILRIYLQKAKTKDILYLMLLWFLFVIVLPIIRNVLDITFIELPTIALSNAVQFLGIYILGYLIVFRYKIKNYFLWIPIFAGSILIAYFGSIIFPNQFADRLNKFPYNFISPEIILSCVALFIIIKNYFSKIKISSKINSLISSISKASLGIYFTHEIFMIIIYKYEISFDFSFEKTLCVFIASYIFVLILKRLPILKHLVP